jgi:hypothetical protein
MPPPWLRPELILDMRVASRTSCDHGSWTSFPLFRRAYYYCWFKCF